jgi:dethiobiotin synthetase
VLVEGAGGLMSPVSDEEYNADLADEFGYPLVVVAANELGTINATLQTLIVADTLREGLKIAGIVLNSPQPATGDRSVDSNADELSRRSVPPILSNVSFGGGLDADVDWYALAEPQ